MKTENLLFLQMIPALLLIGHRGNHVWRSSGSPLLSVVFSRDWQVSEAKLSPKWQWQRQRRWPSPSHLPRDSKWQKQRQKTILNWNYLPMSQQNFSTTSGRWWLLTLQEQIYWTFEQPRWLQGSYFRWLETQFFPSPLSTPEKRKNERLKFVDLLCKNWANLI